MRSSERLSSPRGSRLRAALASVLCLAAAALGAAPSSQAAVAPVYSTYFGGSGYEMTLGSAVDSQGDFFVTGSTRSPDLPTTADAPQRAYGGGTDAFVAKFDPSGNLAYATYLGGSAFDEGRGVAVDSAGNVYVDGFTDSADFPTRNALDPALRGRQDAFVAKLDRSGAVVFSTLVGGGGTDTALAIAVDPSGAPYLTGETDSSDFPTTPGAFDTSANGDIDAFVSKLTPAGDLAYSSYLGSPRLDDGLAIAVDGSGQAFVTGKASPGFPVTPEAFDTTPNGDYDMFVTKLDPTGSNAVYSTYLGGARWDEGLGIAVDPAGSAYVTGNVQSPNYPVTAGALQRDFRGAVDASVTKLTPSGSGLVYSTLLGGEGWTEGDGVQLGPDGSAYVAGHLGSSDLPTTAGAVSQQYRGLVDGFLAKVDPDGSVLRYATYLGGRDWDGAMTFALDSAGDAYLSGATRSDDFPLTPGAFQPARAGDFDSFATKVEPIGPPAQPDFALATAPRMQAVVRGNRVAFSVTVIPHNGWSDPVTLDVSGLPPGATAKFSPNPAQSSSALIVATSGATPAGTYRLTIGGQSQGVRHTDQVYLVVRVTGLLGLPF